MLALKLFLIFLGLTAVICVFVGSTFFAIGKAAETKTLLGHTFASIWTFWLAFLVLISPLILTANYFMMALYSHGFKWFAGGSTWPIQLVLWAAGPCAYLIMNYFWRGDWPTQGQFVAVLLYIAAAMVSIFWK